MDKKPYNALEHALTELESGKDISNLMSAYADLDADLGMAQLVKQLSPVEIPRDIMHRSRTRVLTRAKQLRQESQSIWGFIPRIPRLIYALILAAVLLLSWNGLVFAADQTIPGDQLYQTKLILEKIRLGLALNPQAHQKVEEEYLARRMDEVAQLLVVERVEFVQFSGLVELQRDDHWIIDGVEVRLDPETILLGDIQAGTIVEIEGVTQIEGWVLASEIHLLKFSFIGTVERISRTTWIISGQEVRVTSESQIVSDIQVGDTVVVDVSSDDFGTLTARLISPYHLEDDGFKITATPAPSEVTEEPVTPDEPGETDDLDETDEPEATDDPGETDDPDETDDPEETDEPGETDDPDETDEPDEPDETDEPEETE